MSFWRPAFVFLGYVDSCGVDYFLCAVRWELCFCIDNEQYGALFRAALSQGRFQRINLKNGPGKWKICEIFMLIKLDVS